VYGGHLPYKVFAHVMYMRHIWRKKGLYQNNDKLRKENISGTVGLLKVTNNFDITEDINILENCSYEH
jgi:hypothetical protein